MRGIHLVSAAAAALVIAEACSAPVARTLTDAGDTMRDVAVALDDGGLGTVAEVVRDAGTAMYDAGAAMRTDGAVEADEGTADGSRLVIRRRRYSGADGATLVGPPQLFDTVLGSPCIPAFGADGKWRCMPLGSARVASGYYADDACIRPVALVVCGFAAVGDYALAVEDQCGAKAFYRLTSQLETAYVRSDDACNPILPHGLIAFAIGDAIEESSLVELTGDWI